MGIMLKWKSPYNVNETSIIMEIKLLTCVILLQHNHNENNIMTEVML